MPKRHENQLNTLTEFALNIGPIKLCYQVPSNWTAELIQTWRKWILETSRLESEPILHTASISFGAEYRRRGKQNKLVKHNGNAATSLWHWAIDPRYFEDDEWLDWRGQLPDRRNLIDLSLRNVLSALCQEHDSLLMHASTIVLNGKGYVAPGKSGKGKTTFFNLLGGYEAGHLHEDLAFILNDRIYALPCRSSSTTWEMPSPKSIELGGFISLDRGSLEVMTLTLQQDKLEVIGSACVFPLKTWSAEAADHAFLNVLKLSKRTRVVRVAFSLTTNEQALKDTLSYELD